MKWLSQLANTSDTDVPKVFSTSYGEDEDAWSLPAAIRMNTEFQKAGVRGSTLLAPFAFITLLWWGARTPGALWDCLCCLCARAGGWMGGWEGVDSFACVWVGVWVGGRDLILLRAPA